MTPQRLFLVDAMAIAFRAYYAFGVGRPLTTSAGQPVSALFGTALFLQKLLTEQRPDYMVIARDMRQPTFRHEMYPKYKANRTAMPEDLAAQMPHLERLLNAFGCPMLGQPGFEADDLIGTLARRWASPDLHVYIVSGDKDFMQLIDDHTFLYTPKKGEEATIIGRQGVYDKFSCTPEQVIDCLALIGDASDNVPGVPGIGDKGASKLIAEYGSLDKILDNIPLINNKKMREALLNGRDLAYLSKKLVTIRTDVEIPLELADAACDPFTAVTRQELRDLYEELEFTGLSKKIDNLLQEQNKQAVTGDSNHNSDSAAPAMPTQAPRADSSEPSEPGEPNTASKLEPRRALDTVLGYQLVNTQSGLSELITILNQARVFSFDTETTGLNINSDRPIGISFSVQSGAAFYLTLNAKQLVGLVPEDVIQQLATVLNATDPVKVGHNIKFDLQMLSNIGLKVKGPFVDTMICDWLLDTGSRQHGLDACCLRHLNYEKIKTSSLIGDRGQLPMLAADIQELTRYACEDADLTLQLYQHLLPLIEAAGLKQVLFDIEMPLVPVLATVEQNGVHIDRGELQRLSRELAAMSDKLVDEVQKLAGEDFNLNSTKQLAEILFNKLKIHEQLGIKNLKKTKSGFSTDESVLSRLTAHPLPRALLEYRSITKLQGTYVNALPELIEPVTGRVHTSFHQTGTATGRLSSSAPNLQNIPIRSDLGREVRKAFTASTSNHRIIAADYSQIELRLLAHLANEEALAQAFASGADIHRSTAAKVFGVAPEAVTDTQRSRAKAINFGILYGMGARRLAAETGTTVAEAAAFIDRYFASYPGINAFIDATIREARATGMTRTVTGRQRPVLGLSDSNQRNVVAAENIAVNTRIQGSAADLIKIAMIEIDQRLTQSKLQTKMLLQVHDELVFESPCSEIDIVVPMIKRSMEQAMTLSVPLAVSVGVGNNWLEAH
ncbi:MAG: DNA polymerase I [Proteobacteria bacterium]|nr:DNA polymerase I [Pseudomonadota bacterium]